MCFILIQFNMRHIEALANALSDSTGSTKGGSAYTSRSTGPASAMDD